jgi:putative membrane protein
MARLVTIVVVNAIALIAVFLIVPGITWTGATEPGPEMLQVVVVALLVGIVNGLVRPIVNLLALPVRLATLGLVGFLINGAMLLVVAWLSGQLDLGFSIGGYPPDLSITAIATAIVAAIVMGIVTAAANFLLRR